jgi:hypothetical protein
MATQFDASRAAIGAPEGLVIGRSAVKTILLLALGLILTLVGLLVLVGGVFLLMGMLGSEGAARDHGIGGWIFGILGALAGLLLLPIGVLCSVGASVLLLGRDRYILGENSLQHVFGKSKVLMQLPYDNIRSLEVKTETEETGHYSLIAMVVADLRRDDTMLDRDERKNNREEYGCDVAILDFYALPLATIHKKLAAKWKKARAAAPAHGAVASESAVGEGAAAASPPGRRRRKRPSVAPGGFILAVSAIVTALLLLLVCGGAGILWFVLPRPGQPVAQQAGGPAKTPAKEAPADPELTPPDQRGAPPWTPAPAVTDIEPANPAQLPGVAGYWPLDEGEGTAVADQTGQCPAGKVVGGWWINGVRGKAVLFDGKSDYINLGEEAPLNVGDGEPFTVSVWVATRNEDGTIVLLRHVANGAPLINVYVSGGTIQALVRADTPEFGEARVTGAKVADGRWHHVAVSRNQAGLVTIYLDAVKTGQGSGGNSKGPITTNLRVLGSERYLVLQGQGFNRRLHYLNGAVDEFAFFKRELSGAELKQLAGKR